MHPGEAAVTGLTLGRCGSVQKPDRPLRNFDWQPTRRAKDVEELELIINSRPYTVTVEAEMPVLWVLRDLLNLTGTKYGCGMALCGACTVLVDGRAVRACVTPISQVAKQEIRTIEGLGPNHPLQQAWLEEQVVQCGYCQSGQLMSAAALIETNPSPNDAAIDAAMAGNICRCGTYPRIRKAIKRAAQLSHPNN
jgi:isoquinoline 1-oxidoreductase subunit alpha